MPSNFCLDAGSVRIGQEHQVDGAGPGVDVGTRRFDDLGTERDQAGFRVGDAIDHEGQNGATSSPAVNVSATSNPRPSV